MLRNIKKNRELIFLLTRLQILQRYKGTYLGLLWTVINPLAMMVVYTFVFSVIIKVNWWGNVSGSFGEFAIILFAGYIAFNVFSDSIMAAPGLIPENPNYVKKVIFPLETLPIILTLSSVIDSLFSIVILIICNIIIMGKLSWTIILLPLMYVPLILLSLGVSWILATIGVFFKDTKHMVAILTQVLFFLTPLFYPLSAVPERFRIFYNLNPLASIVNNFRRIILWGKMPVWDEFIIVSFYSLIICIFGYFIFTKNKKMFSDVI